MVYDKKKIKRNRKRNVKKSNFKSKFCCGDYHQYSDNPFSAGVMIPNAASRTTSYDLTSITKGDLLTNRSSNLIYINNINMRLNIRNSGTQMRGARLSIVKLRGSTSVADVTNFTDLYINALFTATGPTGNDYDGVLRINQDLYEVVSDRKFNIPGTLGGESPTKAYNINIPIKKYVSYAYNSSVPRKGGMYMILTVYESPGTAPAAAFVATEGDFTVHFYDINRSTKVP